MADVTFTAGGLAPRGRLGNIVYKQRHGRTMLSSVPSAPVDGWSDAQQANREVFRTAAAYAQSVLSDPLAARAYARLAQERKRPVNSILIADFRTPPTVDEISFDEYRGAAGN